MYLSEVCSSGPLAEQWSQLHQLYEKRLWHELTEQMLIFVKNEHFKTNGGLIELYEQFLSDFEHRINPLSLVELILVIAEELTDHEKALELYKKTEEKIKGIYQLSVISFRKFTGFMSYVPHDLFPLLIFERFLAIPISVLHLL